MKERDALFARLMSSFANATFDALRLQARGHLSESDFLQIAAMEARVAQMAGAAGAKRNLQPPTASPGPAAEVIPLNRYRPHMRPAHG